MKLNGVNSSDTWIFVLPKSCMNGDGDNIVMSLPHPRTDKNTKFLINVCDETCKLFELNRHQNECSSWIFNEQSVLADGSLFISTPFDPLYLILNELLNEETGKFVLINQLFSGSCELPDVGLKLLNCLPSLVQMENIAESTGTAEFTAYRFNEAKTLRWLKAKVERLADVVSKRGVMLGVDPAEGATAFAFGLISDYLPSKLSTKLGRYLGIEDKIKKRKSCGSQPSAKKAKEEPVEDYSKQLKTSNIVNKKSRPRSHKCLDKVDKRGMKTMSSFFTVKSKLKD
ncbi:unnamed protein product [Clavelina lepadiformis]|uniref:Ribonuclease H2 subunit B n=1 Tax=Clavelina lepadiformis TaxID=159417 RepID=A0ABP0FTE8_CLALP